MADNRLEVWRTKARTLAAHIRFDSEILAMDASSQGLFALLANGELAVLPMDFARPSDGWTRSLLGDFVQNEHWNYAIEVSDDSRQLAILAPDGLYSWRLNTGNLSQRLDGDLHANYRGSLIHQILAGWGRKPSLSFSRDGDKLFYCHGFAALAFGLPAIDVLSFDALIESDYSPDHSPSAVQATDQGGAVFASVVDEHVVGLLVQDKAGQEIQRQFFDLRKNRRFNERFRALALSGDGKLLLGQTADLITQCKDGRMICVSMSTFEEYLYDMDIAQDAPWAVTASIPGPALLELPARTDPEFVSWVVHPAPTDVTFSLDGKHVAVAYESGLLRAWHGEPFWQYEYARSPILNVEGGLCVGSQESIVFGLESRSFGVEWDASLWVISSRDGSATREVGILTGLSSLASTEDGTRFATGHLDGRVFAYSSKEELQCLVTDEPAPVMAIAFSPNGKWIATALKGGTIGANPVLGLGDEVGLSDLPRHRSFELPSGTEASCVSVAVADEYEILLAGGDDGRLRIWDLSTGDLLDLVQCAAPITDLDVMREGAKAVVSDAQGFVYVIDLNRGFTMDRFRAHQRSIVAIDVFRQRLVTVSMDYSACVWDLSSLVRSLDSD